MAWLAHLLIVDLLEYILILLFCSLFVLSRNDTWCQYVWFFMIYGIICYIYATIIILIDNNRML